jgi:hypothetical protein
LKKRKKEKEKTNYPQPKEIVEFSEYFVNMHNLNPAPNKYAAKYKTVNVLFPHKALSSQICVHGHVCFLFDGSRLQEEL